MIKFEGKGVSAGYAIGTLRYMKKHPVTAGSPLVLSAPDEEKKFFDALVQTVTALNGSAEKLRSDGDETSALLLEAHAGLAEDPDFNESILEKIRGKYMSAANAVISSGEEFATLFEAMEGNDMKARGEDIRDVARRIVSVINGVSRDFSLDEPSVVGADYLSPSEAVSFDRTRLLGIVTVGGSAAGHTAIMARTRGIPAVVGVGDGFDSKLDGKKIIVDGFFGCVYADPDSETLKKYEELIDKQEKANAELAGYAGLKNVSKSGKTLQLCCNIQCAADVTETVINEADGIGLYRSEFLFLGRKDAPGEEEQFEAYRAVLEKMKGKPVTVRTLDIGADKKVPYLNFGHSENPALGMRGLRLSLENPKIFRTQLRALYRASAYGNLSVMFPMVANVREVLKARVICEEVICELHSAGIKTADFVPVGIMIETPAAALLSDELAKYVDFFSCGTNDLTQYTLAVDRMDSDLDKYYDPYHPAIMKLLKMTAENGHRANIRVGICGDLASDADMTGMLLDMGIDSLSVTPDAILKVRRAIINN